MKTLWHEIDEKVQELQKKKYPINPYILKYSFPSFVQLNEKIVDYQKLFDINRKLKTITNGLSKKIKQHTSLSSIDEYLYFQASKHKVFPSILGYEKFPKSSCISLNNVVCHGVPYNINMKEGDIVTVDYCLYNGMHTDWAHTYVIGKVSGEHKKLVETTEECLRKAIDICKPGTQFNEIGNIVTKVANDNGFYVIEKYGGHKIGAYIHLKPYISNHPNDSKEIMKEGDVFTIEPLLSIGSGKTFIANDGFSVLTYNRQYAAHFERCILITDSGHQVLND
jgi:methionyl aminopeptidase